MSLLFAVYQELKPSHQPLIIQGQRLDAFEYYFEVRRKDSLSTQVPVGLKTRDVVLVYPVVVENQLHLV